MRKFVAIEVGPRSSVEVDVEGRWLVRWGVPITIRGFKCTNGKPKKREN